MRYKILIVGKKWVEKVLVEVEKFWCSGGKKS